MSLSFLMGLGNLAVAEPAEESRSFSYDIPAELSDLLRESLAARREFVRTYSEIQKDSSFATHNLKLDKIAGELSEAIVADVGGKFLEELERLTEKWSQLTSPEVAAFIAKNPFLAPEVTEKVLAKSEETMRDIFPELLKSYRRVTKSQKEVSQLLADNPANKKNAETAKAFVKSLQLADRRGPEAVGDAEEIIHKFLRHQFEELLSLARQDDAKAFETFVRWSLFQEGIVCFEREYLAVFKEASPFNLIAIMSRYESVVNDRLGLFQLPEAASYAHNRLDGQPDLVARTGMDMLNSFILELAKPRPRNGNPGTSRDLESAAPFRPQPLPQLSPHKEA